MSQSRLPSLVEVFSVLAIFLAIVFSFTIYELPIQLALFISLFVVIGLGLRVGYRYDDLQSAMIKGISNGLEAVLILLAVGALVGTWIAGGVVPTLIYYGLEFIHPSIFLLATLVICSVTALATGTSWGTVGTAGIAMMGIGEGLGMPLPMVAGAILSGAYFGDKLSPLSDSTVLTASMSKVNVIQHVKSMLYLDVPAFVITGILFTIAGFVYGGGEANLEKVNSIMTSLSDVFTINGFMLIPAAVVIGLLVLKKPSVPTISFGALLGVIWAIIFQGVGVSDAIGTAYNGFSIESNIDFINDLLARGGISGMLGSIVVIIFGLGFGGLLEKIGVLQVIMDTFISKIRSGGSLTSSTLLVGFFSNVFGCAMYVSLILTPKIMERSYDKLKYRRDTLSRNTEVGGTMTSSMVPWSDNGIYMAATLGISTFAYVPFMWMSFVSIIIALIFGYTGKFMWKTEETPPTTQNQTTSA